MNFKEKRVLVTGHNGFIGQNLIKELKKFNAEVLTLTEKKGDRIDIRDWQKVKKWGEYEDVDIIYHLAARTYVPFSYENPRKVFEVNLLGTLNILELARRVNTEKVVFTSSYVYGKPKYLPIDEKHPLDPLNPYSKSKLLAEELLEAYNNYFGLNSVIFRPFNIYGKNQDDNFLIPSIIKQLKNDKIILKDSAPRRDFIYITDVVNALLKVIFLKSDFDIFNIGYGKSYSVKQIVDEVISLYGKPIEVKYTGERRENEVMDTVADIKKAKSKFSWKPKIDISDGLGDVLSKEKLFV